jgi:hypothetical protein
MKLVGRKMSRRISIAVALSLFFLGSSEAKSAPANTLREIYTALGERSGRAVAVGAVPIMKRALESAGVEFIAENGSGAGVKFMKGKLN